jgi:hypothetical protein
LFEDILHEMVKHVTMIASNVDSVLIITNIEVLAAVTDVQSGDGL